MNKKFQSFGTSVFDGYEDEKTIVVQMKVYDTK
jgi:hypothetical protein